MSHADNTPPADVCGCSCHELRDVHESLSGKLCSSCDEPMGPPADEGLAHTSVQCHQNRHGDCAGRCNPPGEGCGRECQCLCRTPPAAVCEGCDHDPHDPGLCIATIPFRGDDEARVTCDCGGTGDRPAVTDAEVQAAKSAHEYAMQRGASWEEAVVAALEAAAATRNKETR